MRKRVRDNILSISILNIQNDVIWTNRFASYRSNQLLHRLWKTCQICLHLLLWKWWVVDRRWVLVWWLCLRTPSVPRTVDAFRIFQSSQRIIHNLEYLAVSIHSIRNSCEPRCSYPALNTNSCSPRPHPACPLLFLYTTARRAHDKDCGTLFPV